MVDYQNLEDRELIYRTATGEKDALEAIYTRYSSSVYSLARYMLRHEAVAEEATQEVFLNLWLKAASYNPSRGEPRTWIMSVAHHKIIDIIRSRRRATTVTDPKEYETLDLLPSGGMGTDEEAERNLEGERVRRALDKLPPAQQEASFFPTITACPNPKSRQGWANPWVRSRHGRGWLCKNYG